MKRSGSPGSSTPTAASRSSAATASASSTPARAIAWRVGGFVAEHGAGRDQGGRLLAQPAQPRFDRGGDAGGVLAEPLQPLGRDRLGALVAQHRRDLGDEQRVAAGEARADRRGVLLDRLREARFEQLADAGRS